MFCGSTFQELKAGETVIPGHLKVYEVRNTINKARKRSGLDIQVNGKCT